MNDLLKKLNVLLKSSVNDAVHSSRSTSDDEPSRRQARVDRNVDVEIAALRERINDAVRYEEKLKTQAQQFEAEAARWDRQADEAVASGNDAGARYAIEQMKRAEQRNTMAQADLRAHQQAAQELIQRVNMLDAVVADARRAQEAEAQASAASRTEQQPASEPLPNLQLPDLGNVLREAREKITSLGELANAQRELSAEQTDDASDDTAVDDDLDARRQRLSKR